MDQIKTNAPVMSRLNTNNGPRFAKRPQYPKIMTRKPKNIEIEKNETTNEKNKKIVSINLNLVEGNNI
jgi:hypothetical protein